MTTLPRRDTPQDPLVTLIIEYGFACQRAGMAYTHAPEPIDVTMRRHDECDHQRREALRAVVQQVHSLRQEARAAAQQGRRRR